MSRRRGSGFPKLDKAARGFSKAAGRMLRAGNRGFKPPRWKRSKKAGCGLALCLLLAAPVLLWLIIGSTW